MEEVKLYCHAMNPLAKLGEIGLAELDRCPIAFWDGHREGTGTAQGGRWTAGAVY